MKSENKPTLFHLPRQTLQKLDSLDEMMRIVTGKGNNKSQIVREAIERLWAEKVQVNQIKPEMEMEEQK